MPVSFSTQRNAGMSSLEPSRIPAWLAPVWEAEVGLPLDQRCVPSPSQRASTGALPSRIARRRTGGREPVDLQEQNPGCVGPDPLSLAPCDPLDDAQRVGVVVVDAEDHLQHEARRRDQQRGEQRISKRVDLEVDRVERGDEQQDRGVDREHDQKPDHERERQPERGHDRRQERVQHPDEHGRLERPGEALDVDSRKQRRGDPHRHRANQQRDRGPLRRERRPGRVPAHALPVIYVVRRAHGPEHKRDHRRAIPPIG